MLGKPLPEKPILQRKCYAGIRFFTVPESGVLQELPQIEDVLKAHPKVKEIVYTKKLGDNVLKKATNGVDFVGYIIVADEDASIVVKIMDQVEDTILHSMKVYVTVTSALGCRE